MSRLSVATTSDPPDPHTDAHAATEPQLPEAPGDLSGADRRVHKRHTLADVPCISRVRLRYGPAVVLIDLSAGGAQIETTSFRLQPGSSVVIELVGDEREIPVPATVLRCQLATLLPEPVYRGALIFKTPLDLESLGLVTAPAAEEPELDHTLEGERLRQVLCRLSGRSGDTGDVLIGALNAAVAVLETPAGRRSGPALASELAGLLKATTDALAGQTKPAALIAAIEDHLRRVMSARAVRLDDTNSFLQLPGSEAIVFSIPSLDSSVAPAKVVVEFSQDCEPLEWHLQLLKSALHLIALVRELARRVAAPGAQPPQRRLPAGWHRVVARYAKGAMIKGFTQHFLAANGSLMVSPAPEARANTRITVPFKDLKAIFFVRDDDGSSGSEGGTVLDPATRGRKVSVTFADGEELVGTTVNYLRSAPGFFVHPADRKSNNERVFVVAGAVRDVTFLQ